MDIFRRVKSRCDFSDFLLSRDFAGKNLTSREIPRSGDAKCTTEIAKCYTILSEKFTED